MQSHRQDVLSGYLNNEDRRLEVCVRRLKPAIVNNVDKKVAIEHHDGEHKTNPAQFEGSEFRLACDHKRLAYAECG